MIRGLHGLFYSSEPEALRAFLRDRLQLPHTDVGEGWLIFDLPEADLGVHPLDESGQPPSGTHDLSFYCDDIRGTVAVLKVRGVEFTQEIEDHGYGFVTYFTMPGGVRVQLYEPKYAKRASARKEAPKARPAKAAKKATKKAAKKAAKSAKTARPTKQARGKGKAAPSRKRR
jgi:predicted enzyme related to lactoylglutathione lyase